MKCNLLKHNSRHSTTYRVTSHLNTTRLPHFHIIHVLKYQNTISLNQSMPIQSHLFSVDSNPSGYYTILRVKEYSSGWFEYACASHQSLKHAALEEYTQQRTQRATNIGQR